MPGLIIRGTQLTLERFRVAISRPRVSIFSLVPRAVNFGHFHFCSSFIFFLHASQHHFRTTRLEIQLIEARAEAVNWFAHHASHDYSPSARPRFLHASCGPSITDADDILRCQTCASSLCCKRSGPYICRPKPSDPASNILDGPGRNKSN